MKDNIIRTAVCPLCGRTYHGAPALSREDNKTLICPDCGTRQALRSIGVDTAEQEQIIETGVMYTVSSTDLCADYAQNSLAILCF